MRLELKGVDLELRLGWPEEERAQPQVVKLDLVIDFATAPEACATDSLEGTVCYDALIREIRSRIRECRLIEALSARIHAIAGELLPPGSRLAVTVHKISVPVPGVSEAAFTYSGPVRPGSATLREIPA